MMECNKAVDSEVFIDRNKVSHVTEASDPFLIGQGRRVRYKIQTTIKAHFSQLYRR